MVEKSVGRKGKAQVKMKNWGRRHHHHNKTRQDYGESWSWWAMNLAEKIKSSPFSQSVSSVQASVSVSWTKKTDGEEFDWAVWLSRPLGVAQKQEPGTDHPGPRSQYPSRNSMIERRDIIIKSSNNSQMASLTQHDKTITQKFIYILNKKKKRRRWTWKSRATVWMEWVGNTS